MSAGQDRPAATTSEGRSRLLAARAALAGCPEVVGVGFGLADHAGPKAAPVWRVYVTCEKLAGRGGVPGELLGLRTDVILAHAGKATAGPVVYTPTMPISNEIDTSGRGTLGCFAKKGNDVVLLSAAHVLFAYSDMAASPQIGIYQPNYSSCCGGGAKIGTTLLSWSDGFRAVPAMPGSFDTDCAIAKLASTIHYQNAIPQIGMITGAGPDPTPAMLLPDFVTKPDDQQLVRMYSTLPGRSGLRYGTILRFKSGTAPSPLSAGPFQDAGDQAKQMRSTANQFLVIPRLQPIANETQAAYAARYAGFVASGGRLTFSEEGDSGSVVVDNRPGGVNVIGLISRAYPASDIRAQFKAAHQPIPDVLSVVDNFGVVTPISNVLAQLQITIPANLAGTAPAAGERTQVFMTPSPFGSDRPAVTAAMQQLQDRLKATRRGALIVTKFGRHRAEASRLVNTVRNVSAIWIRYRGPAFMHHCAQSLREPAHAVPRTIDGVRFADLLEQMRRMLLRYGSSALRRDILRLGPFAIDLLSRVERIHDLPDVLTERKPELV